MSRLARLSLLAALLSLVPAPRALAQSAAECGVVTSVGFPFDDAETNGHYVRYPYGNHRSGWGFHAGEDWLSERGSALGDPVRAVADGLVTYSSPIGWGVDKGVVILEHALHDGSTIYSVYGHMEELNGFLFPPTDTCISKGDIVGAVGDPRGRPHLHFEVRRMWPTFPGFGYTEMPPYQEGYENPTAFLVNWQAWLNPAYKWHIDTPEPMTAAPALAADGTLYVATEGFLQSYAPDGELVYRFPLDAGVVISHLRADENGMLAYTSGGQWRRYEPDLNNIQVRLLGEEGESLMDGGPLLFLYENEGTLRVLDEGLAQRGLFQGVERPVGYAAGTQLVALATGQRAPEVMLFTPGGQLVQRASMRGVADVAPAPDGGVMVRSAHALWHVSPQAEWAFVTDSFEVAPGLSGLAAGWGSTYLYAGRQERQLASLSADGLPYWQVGMDGAITARPAIRTGGGCAVYLGASDGSLAAVNAATGALGESLLIHPGSASAQEAWLEVSADETVYFAVGGRQIIALDGRRMIGLSPDTPCVNPY